MNAPAAHPVRRGSPRRTSSRRRRAPHVAPWAAVAAFVAYAVVVTLREPLPVWVPVLYVAASMLAFVLYTFDKAAAVGGRRRVSERALLAAGVIGGWPGAVAAQQLRRHKTQKRPFQLAFWCSVVVNAAVFVALTASTFTERIG